MDEEKIKALANHFKEAGYHVHTGLGVLIIRKSVVPPISMKDRGDEPFKPHPIIGVDWSFSPLETTMPLEKLMEKADDYIEMLRKKEAEA
jgi:hypothetical protein